MINQLTDPTQFATVFKARFDSANIEALVDGYANDAVLDTGGGNAVRDRQGVRAVLTNFLAAGLPISVVPRHTVVNGDLAVSMFDWSIAGTAPDGSPVAMGGTAVDVLRRDTDGAWHQLIDLPFGTATTA